MLKLAGHGERGGVPVKVVILGLSKINIERLQKGMPISFPGTDVGLKGVEFMILAGETEQSMQHELEELIGEKTKVVISPRLKI